MSNIKLNLAAQTNVGRVRKNNEDNLIVIPEIQGKETVDLGEKGVLLVVADGMGGANAGEVASQFAVDTVKELFTPERITREVTASQMTIERFMTGIVVEADRRIKESTTFETRGMGTTIVMAWLYGENCYVCWCGDSRAYVYNKQSGLRQISKDHSYVQALVDMGKITMEEAFDYPGSNVITRCLCDAKNVAEADCTVAPICAGDIILLCSDGLSGMLRDHEMEKVIAANESDIDVCVDKLIAGALEAGGKDNVTVAAAKVVSGGKPAEKFVAPEPAKIEVSATKTASESKTTTPTDPAKDSNSLPSWLMMLLGFVAVAIVVVLVFWLIPPGE